MSRKIAGIAMVVIALAGSTANAAGIYITEWMYDGSEYIEFTNLGPDAIDMTGWSFDDDSQLPGTVDLSGFGVVAVGESVVLAEEAVDAFRTRWGLGPLVKVIGENATNLGRADELNLFDAAGDLVDRLTYGDVAIPGTIRTQGASGNPNSDSVLGTNNVAAWSLSAVGDAFGSYTSLEPFVIGNPGLYPVTPTPEPSSLVMLATAGGIGVMACRRKHFQKRSQS